MNEREPFRVGEVVHIGAGRGQFRIESFESREQGGETKVYAVLSSPLSPRTHVSAVRRLERVW